MSTYEGIKDFLLWLQGRADRRGDKVDAAIDAIRAATLSTKRYDERSGGKRGFDRDEEFRLAELWGAASTKTRDASVDLAVRLNAKSRYWSDQSDWKPSDIAEKRIGLQGIEEALADLIAPPR